MAPPRGTTRAVAWSTCVGSLVLVSVTVGLLAANLPGITSPDQANAIEIVLPVTFGLIGVMVALRQPRNPLGWLLLAISLATAANGATQQYTRYALLTNPGAPFTAWIPWVGGLGDVLVYPSGLAVVTLLLIPNGRLPSRRWRPVMWLNVVLAMALLLTSILHPALVDVAGFPYVANPTGVAAARDVIEGPIGAALLLASLVVLALAGFAIVHRMRHAEGPERLQLRWIAYAVAFSIGLQLALFGLALTVLTPDQAAIAQTFAGVIGFGIALPLSIGVAILRYRLYDLDLLLNRTVLYGAVTVALIAAFGVANLLAQRAAESAFGQRSELLSAALAVGATITYGPTRRWIRPLVDRALPARGRLTMLFTDIVASTEAIVDLGDEQWREVLDRYRTLVRRELGRHHGREVNTAGDAFFAVFDQPMRAARCALAMREGVRVLGLRVRTGLHIGDVEMRGEQVSGLAVHAAARVMGAANADEVLVSSEIMDALSPMVPVRDAGTHHLKGVPGEWRLFALD